MIKNELSELEGVVNGEDDLENKKILFSGKLQSPWIRLEVH